MSTKETLREKITEIVDSNPFLSQAFKESALRYVNSADEKGLSLFLQGLTQYDERKAKQLEERVAKMKTDLARAKDVNDTFLKEFALLAKDANSQ